MLFLVACWRDGKRPIWEKPYFVEACTFYRTPCVQELHQIKAKSQILDKAVISQNFHFKFCFTNLNMNRNKTEKCVFHKNYESEVKLLRIFSWIFCEFSCHRIMKVWPSIASGKGVYSWYAEAVPVNFCGFLQNPVVLDSDIEYHPLAIPPPFISVIFSSF